MERGVCIVVAVLAVCGYALGVPVSNNVSRAYELFPKDCGRSPLYDDSEPMDRIVGGTLVNRGQYPFVISLRERNPDRNYLARDYPDEDYTHVCGGSIVNKYYILSATHCPIYLGREDLYRVIVGLHRVNELSDPSTTVHQVEKIILHKNYDAKANSDDICLIRLKKPIQFNDRVQPICMPPKKTGDYEPEGMVTVIGWGFTEDDGEISEHLRQVTIPMIPRKVCNPFYDEDPHDDDDYVTSGMICAGRVNKDSCAYDSGGPLFAKVNGRYTIFGIVSFGGKCGKGPGVYTNVALYKDWIRGNMQ